MLPAIAAIVSESLPYEIASFMADSKSVLSKKAATAKGTVSWQVTL